MAESEGQIYEKQLSGVKFKWRNFRYNSSNAWSPRAAPRVRYLDPPIACPAVHASRTINRLSRNCYIYKFRSESRMSTDRTELDIARSAFRAGRCPSC
ncbi:unnamed protein product [Nesidiocoris tenuis]|uniref:Uncharacterized protein n=1 Tax=Nesidiocoris tenuis TaxID=355587 RepID=A0A6H5GYK2_9HEMI|nr:unnamed protein product [Nesidiocoris tenuis]